MAFCWQFAARPSPLSNCSRVAAPALVWEGGCKFHHNQPTCNTTRIGTLSMAALSSRLGSTGRNMSSFRCFSAALNPELKTNLDKVVASNKVVVFIKGTKDFPQCGFSNSVVQILKSLNVPFETMNVLENDILRQGLKEYSSWPTFPQLYINGEFFGGCDITVEAYKSGELQEVLEKAMCS